MTISKKKNIASLGVIITALGLSAFAHADYQNSNSSSYSNGTYGEQDYKNQNDRNTWNVNLGSRNQADDSVSTDQEIAKKIQDKIGSGMFSKGYDQVKVSVINGSVTLQGSVKTPDDKAAVEREVRKVDGVRNVDNQITVQQPSSRYFSDNSYNDYNSTTTPATDQDLTSRIQDAVGSKILVTVRNGNVNLQGSVISSDEKASIEKQVRQIDGVKNVDNQITVQKQDRYLSYNDNNNAYNTNTVSDQDITKKIQDKIGPGWFSKGYDQVQVSVNNGNVTLQGFVDTWDDKTKVEKEVRKIDGVRNINNLINAKEPRNNNTRDNNDTRNNNSNYNGNRNNNVQSDQEIARKIQDNIGPGMFSQGYDKVRVVLNNGNVLLQGFVQTPEDKANVEKAIRNIDGVKNVDNQLKVQSKDSQNQNNSRDNRNYQNQNSNGNRDTAPLSDEALSKRIQDKLSSGWFSKPYDHVVVHISNNNVTLQGSVKTWDDKEKLEREIRNIDGVRNVNSQLTVEEPKDKDAQKRTFSQDRAATPADEQLNKKIRDDVSRGWLWDSYKTVILNTANGVVTLEGTVDSLSDQQKLQNEIGKVNGVRSVNSNLMIRNNR